MVHPHRRRPHAARQRGASLTEFIIVGPIAILLTFVLLQAGLLYMAKLTLNNATFMAARHGSVNGAQASAIKNSLAKGLVPFYQNAFESSDAARLAGAYAQALAAVNLGLNVKLSVLSPSDEAFRIYGITRAGVTTIPNDNLEFRTAAPIRGAGISLRDANVLRIKVTYAYELKVPLMQAIVKRIMCPLMTADSDVRGWERPSLRPMGEVSDCVYYLQGRVPIVSYATVQMQTPASRRG
ncbi:TadE-like protein [Delftia tsuruhatensis]|uniref:TadE/TadG family type IV pilus assembly protein n=1 Tax=Delftia tsuruhatensis TaxID=180282 RepID=UPI001E72F95D|nr:TadE family protein [Delftia tsuruhatensis]CAB5691604.1 TadE-like protein [Delftia tsuruhatensis]CAC9676864.1 TadE-like protein [Delftia tsuruhatensis]